MLSDVLRHRVPGCEPGIELALIEWPGSGPPALLHHANGFCAALWAPIAERLAERFRVFAVDARGHGDSSKPLGDEAYRWTTMARDLVCVADWVIERADAQAIELGVGHSFGGTLTMAAAAERDGLYRRALLIDPVLLPAPGSTVPHAMAGGNPMAERARKRRHQWESRAEARAFFAEKPLFESWPARALGIYLDEALADAAQGVELKCPGRVEAAIFNGGRLFDPHERAEKANLPIRIVRATEGNFSLETYREIVAVLAQGELTEIEGGHLVVMERPAAVVDAVFEFVGADWAAPSPPR
ncbi:MAG: alpha/beta hydrolase [Myxococcota bacterium]|nr:alpha/beta hydrolase [Myxococcota bacterium]